MVVLIRHNGITIDRATRTITHRGVTLRQQVNGAGGYRKKYANDSGYRFEAMERLILAPTSRNELFEHIFGDCEEGGPDHGPNIWFVRFHQWERFFKKLQLKLVKEKRAGVTYFMLVPDVV